METLYIIVLQLIIGVLTLEFLPLFLGVIILCFFSIIIGMMIERRSPLLWIIPIIFFIRFYTSTYSENIELEKKITVQTRVYAGRGEILKIDGKYPRERGYLILEKIPDSEYILEGNIEKIIRKKGYWEYGLKVEKLERVEGNFFRKRLENLIDKRIESFTYSEKNLYKGVILGVKEPIFKKIKTLFLESGLMHILAISGLHIGIIILIFRKLGECLPLKKLWRELFILMGLTFYYLGLNLTPSVERAYIMGVIYILGGIVYENISLGKSLAFSFVISLLINPVVYRDPSFLMSYWAMFSICLWINLKKIIKLDKSHREIKKIENNWRDNSIKRCKEYLIFSLYIQITMAPLLYLVFGKISFLAMVKSIILTPVGILYIYTSFILLLLPFPFLVRGVYWFLITLMEIL